MIREVALWTVIRTLLFGALTVFVLHDWTAFVALMVATTLLHAANVADQRMADRERFGRWRD